MEFFCIVEVGMEGDEIGELGESWVRKWLEKNWGVIIVRILMVSE